YLFLVVFVFLVMFPFIWVFLTSIKPVGEIFSSFNWFTKNPSFDSYIAALTHMTLERYMLNSIVISTVPTLLSAEFASFLFCYIFISYCCFYNNVIIFINQFFITSILSINEFFFLMNEIVIRYFVSCFNVSSISHYLSYVLYHFWIKFKK